MTTMEQIVSEAKARRLQWQDRVRYVPGSGTHGYAHTRATVEILDGNPPDRVLIDAGDRWGLNFGGRVERRWCEDGKRLVSVKVYTD